ncbi:precorrin-3B C(17)-methyltransferase [Halocatena halophila]|uniref:precorrin-3B C(17)-methyltransferase n=1 Tax=Halocatena halophila TaxID=2814576 RepID=UPI002ED1EF31
MTAPTTSPRADDGVLYVVGMGPGLPRSMTQAARSVIERADCVIASNLYQSLLRTDSVLPEKARTREVAEDVTVAERSDGTEQTIIRSSMGRQIELTEMAFDRVRDGEIVAHVSGGDPNVYGKSDLVFQLAAENDVTDVPIEVVPGVTAALACGGRLGAPLSNDFCTISLSEKWRPWEQIEEKLRAATTSGFVIVLYNCWRNYARAIEVIREHRADAVPVGIVVDAGREDAGRQPEGESQTITTLGGAPAYDDAVGGMGTSIVVGTSDSRRWENDFRTHLLTRRGGRDVTEF